MSDARARIDRLINKLNDVKPMRRGKRGSRVDAILEGAKEQDDGAELKDFIEAPGDFGERTLTFWDDLIRQMDLVGDWKGNGWEVRPSDPSMSPEDFSHSVNMAKQFGTLMISLEGFRWGEKPGTSYRESARGARPSDDYQDDEREDDKTAPDANMTIKDDDKEDVVGEPKDDGEEDQPQDDPNDDSDHDYRDDSLTKVPDEEPDDDEYEVYTIDDLMDDGLAADEGVGEEDVDAEQLARGIEVEKEHTDDEEVAKKIALDHLAEIPDYYTRLADMEADAEGGKADIEPAKSPVEPVPQPDVRVGDEGPEELIDEAAEYSKMSDQQLAKAWHDADEGTVDLDMDALLAELSKRGLKLDDQGRVVKGKEVIEKCVLPPQFKSKLDNKAAKKEQDEIDIPWNAFVDMIQPLITEAKKRKPKTAKKPASAESEFNAAMQEIEGVDKADTYVRTNPAFKGLVLVAPRKRIEAWLKDRGYESKSTKGDAAVWLNSKSDVAVSVRTAFAGVATAAFVSMDDISQRFPKREPETRPAKKTNGHTNGGSGAMYFPGQEGPTH